MDIVIRALIAICVWFLTFSTGRYYEITKHMFWADTTDNCIFVVSTIVSLGASVWIAII